MKGVLHSRSEAIDGEKRDVGLDVHIKEEPLNRFREILTRDLIDGSLNVLEFRMPQDLRVHDGWINSNHAQSSLEKSVACSSGGASNFQGEITLADRGTRPDEAVLQFQIGARRSFGWQ